MNKDVWYKFTPCESLLCIYFGKTLLLIGISIFYYFSLRKENQFEWIPACAGMIRRGYVILSSRAKTRDPVTNLFVTLNFSLTISLQLIIVFQLRIDPPVLD